MTKKEKEITKKWIERTYKNIKWYEENKCPISKKYEIGRFLGICGLADELKINIEEIITLEKLSEIGEEYVKERNKEF